MHDIAFKYQEMIISVYIWFTDLLKYVGYHY